MEKLSELKTTLSNEWKKPKCDRDYDLIRSIETQIKQEKAILRAEYKNRERENHDAEVKLRLSLYKKKNDMYGKVREEKKREKLEHEKKQIEKIKQKKSK